MRKLTTTLGQFYCLYIFIFIIFTIVSFFITLHSANKMVAYGTNKYLAFYWLSPSYFALLSENIILLWSGIMSCVAGAMIPITSVEEVKSLVIAICRIIFFNLLSLIFSLVTVLCLELINVPIRNRFDLNIAIHSGYMFLSMLIFLIFWSLFALGLRITFNSRIISIIIGICIQLGELFIVFRYAPEIEIYLPTALSRQLIVSQFPFWSYGSWANVKGAVLYANSSMIVDRYYNNIPLNQYWLPVMLAYYGSIVFVVPVVRIIDKYIIHRKSIL